MCLCYIWAHLRTGAFSPLPPLRLGTKLYPAVASELSWPVYSLLPLGRTHGEEMRHLQMGLEDPCMAICA